MFRNDALLLPIRVLCFTSAVVLWAEASLAEDDSLSRGQLIAPGGGPGGRAAACFSCHGIDGAGQAATGFPRLAGLDARYLAKQLADYSSGERSSDIMRPIARALSAADRRAVARYYENLSVRIGPRLAAISDPELLQAGAVLYARGVAARNLQACTNCHGPAGHGLAPTFPALAGQPTLYVSQQLRLWRDGRRTNSVANVMQHIASRMDDRDIDAVAAYLASLSPTDPRVR